MDEQAHEGQTRRLAPVLALCGELLAISRESERLLIRLRALGADIGAVRGEAARVEEELRHLTDHLASLAAARRRLLTMTSTPAATSDGAAVPEQARMLAERVKAARAAKAALASRTARVAAVVPPDGSR